MDDFDIREFAKMFDAALASDNPSVKKALRNFLMVVAIVDAENDSKMAKLGPFSAMIEEINQLKAAVAHLQSEMSITRYNKTSIYPNTSTTNIPHTWIQHGINGINTVSMSTGTPSSYAAAIRNHVQSGGTTTVSTSDILNDFLIDESFLTSGTNNGNQSN